MPQVSQSLAQQYRTDGVVCLPGAVDTETLKFLEDGFNWSVSNPSPSASEFYAEGEKCFYQDLCNPRAAHVYREALTNSSIPDIIAELWESQDVWFLYEQIFFKRGGDVRRTPWHQDTPYLALDGNNVAVMWINFQPLPHAESLEFVRGSHRGTLYDGSAFDPDDDTKPVFGHGLPRLPNIESKREDWDIISWPIELGDVVVFHPSVLHGGAPTPAAATRRTLSLRFFGNDAAYAVRPDPAPAPLVDDLHEKLRPGQAFRHPAFPRLRPEPAGFEAIPADFHHAPISIDTRMEKNA